MSNGNMNKRHVATAPSSPRQTTTGAVVVVIVAEHFDFV